MQASRTDVGEIPEQRPETVKQPEQGESSVRPQGEKAEPERQSKPELQQKSDEKLQSKAMLEQKSVEVSQPKAEPEADSMPEKSEVAENGNPEISGETKAETPSYFSGLLEEEEVSELLDMVLCADDLVPDARVWHSEICSFFQRGNSQEKKANALKLIYGELDEDYIIQDGGYQVHVLG